MHKSELISQFVKTTFLNIFQIPRIFPIQIKYSISTYHIKKKVYVNNSKKTFLHHLINNKKLNRKFLQVINGLFQNDYFFSPNFRNNVLLTTIMICLLYKLQYY